MLRVLGILFFVFFALSNQCFSAEKPRVSSAGNDLKENSLYYVTYTCFKTGDLDDFLKRQSRNPFIKYSSATHVFAITTSDVNLDDSTFNNGSSIAPRHLFTVAKVGGGPVVRDQMGDRSDPASNPCRGEMLIKGSDKPKIAYYLKYSRQTVPSGFLRALSLVVDVAAPVFTLITGNALPSDTDKDFKNVKDVVTKYNAYLALFTDPESTARVIGLKTGTTTIQTSASRVVIKVTKVDNLLLSGIPFRDNIGKLIKLTHQYDKTNIESSCSFVQKKIYDARIKQKEDIAYIIYDSASIDSYSKKDEFIRCLGITDLAPFVIKNRRLFESYIPETILIGEEDIKQYLTAHPPAYDPRPDIETKKKLLRLQDIMARSAQQNGLHGDDRVPLREIASDTLTVNDKTYDLTLSPNGTATVTTGSPEDQVKRFVSARYSKFGCFQLTRSAPTLEAELDGATAMMLAQRPAKDATPAKVVGLRLFFEDGKVREIVVTENWLPQLRLVHGSCTL